ncbi:MULTISPECIES: I78 family peptidase inhibitor [unclassified Sphingomonas]|jgi:Peptidase inhibitor I78 family|uniref:I78 family peptidase inhibitor n=1 Tax=unclassified Sphingomonas TaxID=196159 RepID=UPI000E109AA9|nr:MULTISPECIES: I78 family peptidase inhibitor [unclassified Sphingomonas]AXJ96546.1 hypothetical protein DM480_14650 [Sphingomonas sp. FARSPH]
MTRTGLCAGLAVSLVLGGCATTREAPLTGPCRVTQDMHARYAGMKFRARMRDRIQRDANAPVARILRDRVPATMDFRVERLNIHLDDTGRIEGLRCG